ncbi:hypothetical protein ACFXG3_31245, partial [Nocardia tengchongensis]
FTVRDGQFQLLDSRGALLAGTPLRDSRQADELSDATVAFTPTGSNVTAPTTPLHDVDATADFNGALGLAATQFGLATGVGTLAGGIVGAGVGCAAGALTGGFVALPTGPIAVPAAAFGCIVGASVGIGIGSLAGAAVVGIPVGIASAVQMYNTLNAPVSNAPAVS